MRSGKKGQEGGRELETISESKESETGRTGSYGRGRESHL